MILNMKDFNNYNLTINLKVDYKLNNKIYIKDIYIPYSSRSCPANFFELFFKNSKTGHEPCLKHNKKSSKENLFMYK